MWKTDLKGAKNEWSRIGAIMEAQEFGVEDLNDLTGHRRRMSSQKGESLVGASLSQRRLNQAEELRDRAESLLAHVESQILAYELKRREFVAHKQAASIEYAVSACVDGRQPLSAARVLQSQSRAVEKKTEEGMKASIEYASLALANPVRLYSIADRKNRRSISEAFELDLSDMLKMDVWKGSNG